MSRLFIIAAPSPSNVLEYAEGEFPHRLLVDEIQRFQRRKAPVRGAVGEDLHQGEALAVQLILEGLANGLFRLQDIGRGGPRAKRPQKAGRLSWAIISAMCMG